MRREGELAVRAALGASRGALRRTLLAESLVLCGAGAVLGVLLAGPMVSLVSRFAARFSVRALEVSVDAGLLWVGAALAIAAAVLLAYVPRLPATTTSSGLGLASASLRMTPGTNRRLRAFATVQIAFSFVLLAGAGTLIATLIALQSARTGYNMRQVLAIDVPSAALTEGRATSVDFMQQATERISKLPGVWGSPPETSCHGAMPAPCCLASSSRSRGISSRMARRTHTRESALSRRAFSRCSAFHSWPAATSTMTIAPGANRW